MMSDFAAVPAIETASPRDRRRTRRKSAIERNLVSVDMGAVGGGMVLDASAAGLGIQTRGAIRLGAIVDVNLLLPEEAQVRAAGVVAWSNREGRAGIRLAKLKNGNGERFKNWLSSLPELTDMPRAAAGPPATYSEATRNAVAAIEERIRTERQRLDASLKLIVQRLAALPGASGSAIALGSPDEMVCCQSTGLAPDLGVRINPNAGLTGECIRTRKVVQCDDTEADPRVNRAVCRTINMRSCVIVPVRTKGQVLGVLEVLAQRPRAFSATDVELLCALADLVEKLAFGEYRELQASGNPATEIASEPTYGKLAALDGILDGIEGAEEEPPEVSEALPDQNELDDLIATMFSSGDGAPQAGHSLREIEPAQPVQVSDARITPVILTTEAVAVPPAAPALKHPIATEAPVLPATLLQQEGEGAYISRALLLALAAILLALLAGILWGLAGGGGPPTSSIDALPAIAVPHEAQAVKPRAEAPAPSAVPRSEPAKPAQPAPAEALRKNGSFPQKTETELEAVTTISQVIQLPQVSSSVKFTAQPGAAQSAPVTSVSLASAGTKPALTGGQVLKRVNPRYPAEASGMSWQGDVVLSGRITKSGTVERIVRLSGNPVLAEAAMKALKQWRYEPYRVDGQPLEVGTTITVTFSGPKPLPPGSASH